MGGIVSAEDALEYLIAGATAVQVGSAHFIDARAGLKIVDGIRNYLGLNDIPTLTFLIGSLKVKGESP
jgi:dihydroorotate dehydrogenase (NAD+) catalytic subunit